MCKALIVTAHLRNFRAKQKSVSTRTLSRDDIQAIQVHRKKVCRVVIDVTRHLCMLHKASTAHMVVNELSRYIIQVV